MINDEMGDVTKKTYDTKPAKEGQVKRQNYFNLGKKAAEEVVKEYSEGESGSEFIVKLKDLNR